MNAKRRALSAVLLVLLAAIRLAPAAAVCYDLLRAGGSPTAPADPWPDLRHAVSLTLFVSLTASMLSCTFGAMAGYSLSKKRFYGRKLLLGTLIGAIFVPPAVLMAPLFRVTASLGIYDTAAALILPSAVTAFSIVFMKVAIDRVPPEMVDAAKLDGLGEFSIFTQIVLPQVRGPLLALLMLEFAANWGALALPMAVVDSPRNFTLSLRLAAAGQSADPPVAGCLLWLIAIIAVPPLLLFILKSRDMIIGTMSTLFRYERVDAADH